MGAAPVPEALKTTITSAGSRTKFARICSARPSTRSMNIAWRCPFAPAIWVWKVIDSSAIGRQPG